MLKAILFHFQLNLLFIQIALVYLDSLEAGEAAEENKEVKSEVLEPEVTSMKLEPTPHTDSNDRETLSVVNKKPSSAPVRAEKFEFLDGVAAFHATAVKKARERQTLVANIGPHRRALCARRDLAVRRALCKVDKVCLSVL